MSLFGAEFMRTVKEHLGDDVELNFTPHGECFSAEFVLELEEFILLL